MVFKSLLDAEQKQSQIAKEIQLDTTNISKKALNYAREINFDLSLINKKGIVKTQDIDDYLKEH